MLSNIDDNIIKNIGFIWYEGDHSEFHPSYQNMYKALKAMVIHPSIYWIKNLILSQRGNLRHDTLYKNPTSETSDHYVNWYKDPAQYYQGSSDITTHLIDIIHDYKMFHQRKLMKDYGNNLID